MFKYLAHCTKHANVFCNDIIAMVAPVIWDTPSHASYGKL